MRKGRALFWQEQGQQVSGKRHGKDAGARGRGRGQEAGVRSKRHGKDAGSRVRIMRLGQNAEAWQEVGAKCKQVSIAIPLSLFVAVLFVDLYI